MGENKRDALFVRLEGIESTILRISEINGTKKGFSTDSYLYINGRAYEYKQGTVYSNALGNADYERI